MEVWHIYTVLEFIGIGLAAGILAGLFGVGGGIIMGPFLILYLGNRGFPSEILVQLVFGTVLFVIIFTSSIAVWRHNKNGNVMWHAAVPLGLASIIGAAAGATVVAYTPGEILRRIYGIALFLFAYRFLKEIKTKEDKKPRYDRLAVIPSGFAIGFIGGLLGVGGGIIGIPLMSLFLHYPFRKIAGTSSAIIIFTSVSAVGAYIFYGWNYPMLPPGSLGFLNFPIAVPLLAGTLFGVPLGVSIHKKLPSKRLRQLFALFITVEGIKLLF